MRLIALIFLAIKHNSSQSRYPHFYHCINSKETIAVIGAGYAGLVTGIALGYMGHKVTLADIDQKKIKTLQQGVLPLHETHLNEYFESIKTELTYTADVPAAAHNASIIILMVPTNLSDDETTIDLSHLMNALDTIGQSIQKYTIIVTKSTVPVGTYHKIVDRLSQHCDPMLFDVISNPEFFREGCALHDFFNLNPVVIGGDSPSAIKCIKNIYEPLINAGLPYIETTPASAEMIKYAWNAYLALRIAYINELSQLSTACGAEMPSILKGISIAEQFRPACSLRPGPGLAGSCLPKDTRGLHGSGKSHGINMELVHGIIQSDENHKNRLIQTLLSLAEKSPSKEVTVLGLTFKAHSCDIRCSIALDVISALVQAGYTVKAYDPHASYTNFDALLRKRIGEKAHAVTYCASLDQALEAAHCLTILTEWPEFKTITFKDILVFDTRSLFSAAPTSRYYSLSTMEANYEK